MSKLSYEKTISTIKKSDIVLFVVSLEGGVTNSDKELMSMLRKHDKRTLLVINKCDKQKSLIKKYMHT